MTCIQAHKMGMGQSWDEKLWGHRTRVNSRGPNPHETRGELSDPRRVGRRGGQEHRVERGGGWSPRGFMHSPASLPAQKAHLLSSQSTLTLHARNE